jgi:hypothetical protein
MDCGTVRVGMKESPRARGVPCKVKRGIICVDVTIPGFIVTVVHSLHYTLKVGIFEFDDATRMRQI